MNDLVVINGVKGYMGKDGTAYLSLEDVARGLGFTTVATSGNECVRWARVEQYLTDLGFNKDNGYLADDTFIPENIFYRLAMKAKNETAEKFQAKVADEILPSIRKHGTYMTPETIEAALLDPDVIIQMATRLKEERAKRILAEQTVQLQAPKVLFADAVTASKSSVLVGELAKILRQNGVDIGQNRLFGWLRGNGYLCKAGENFNLPTQYAMDLGLCEIKKTTINKPDGSSFVTRTTKITGKGQVYFVSKFLQKEVAHG